MSFFTAGYHSRPTVLILLINKSCDVSPQWLRLYLVMLTWLSLSAICTSPCLSPPQSTPNYWVHSNIIVKGMVFWNFKELLLPLSCYQECKRLHVLWLAQRQQGNWSSSWRSEEAHACRPKANKQTNKQINNYWEKINIVKSVLLSNFENPNLHLNKFTIFPCAAENPVVLIQFGAQRWCWAFPVMRNSQKRVCVGNIFSHFPKYSFIPCLSTYLVNFHTWLSLSIFSIEVQCDTKYRLVTLGYGL